MQYAVRCKNYVRGEKFRNSLELGFNKQRRRSYGGLTLSSVGELGDQVLTTKPKVMFIFNPVFVFSIVFLTNL